MSPLLLGIPAGSDEDLSSEDHAPRNEYLTRRDFQIGCVGVAVLVALFIPFYLRWKAGSERYRCELNFKAVGLAMQVYTAQYDDRFPPTYIPSDDGTPQYDSKSRADSWASIIVTMAGFDKQRSFRCPSSSDDEVARAAGAGGSTLEMTYGMYAPFSTYPEKLVPDPANAILIAESSNAGAQGTFDPTPFPAGPNGKIDDGFLLGWEKSNSQPPGLKVKPSEITRLAFRQAKSGLVPNLAGRHDDSIYVMYADGHIQLRTSDSLDNARFWQLPDR